MTASTTARLSQLTMWTMAAPGACLGAFGVLVTIYLPPYYASHLGLGAAGVASVFFAVRLIDIGVDPMLGVAMDHTHTRLGRYRAWLLLGAPILMVATWLALAPSPGVGPVYLIAILLLLYIGLSIITLANTAWAATLAPAYDDRSRLFAIISVAGVIGSAALLVLPQALHTKSSTDPGLIRAMGWFIIVAAPLGVGWTALRIPEKLAGSAARSHAGLGEYLALLRRPEVLRIVAADLCLGLGPGWMTALYLYNSEIAKRFTAGQASSLLLFYIAAGVVGALMMGRIAARFGKHQTLIACTTGYSLGLISIFALPPKSYALFAPFMMVMGFLGISFAILIRAMLADIDDQIRLETGRHQTALLFSLITLTGKLGSAFSIVMSFQLLPVVGFDPKLGDHNTAAGIMGLQLIFLIGPIVFVMLGGACFLGYKLDARAHADIRKALDERDSLSMLPPDLGGLTGPPSIPPPVETITG
jgi:GPH family glycoside/pentoside/hexuronide:cation symporter